MKQRVSTLLVCLLLALGFSAINLNNAGAVNVAGGALTYTGWQDNTNVYSKIYRNAGISTNYCVRASVKVGGNTYYSNAGNYSLNYDYVYHKKSLWRNETSWYNYTSYNGGC